MNITVYLGSSLSNSDDLINTVRQLGDYIGKNSHCLVYGGSKSGLMGELASHVLDNNGEVIGVEPQFFIDEGYVYDRITNLIVTEDMSSRRLKMIELGDVFIAILLIKVLLPTLGMPTTMALKVFFLIPRALALSNLAFKISLTSLTTLFVIFSFTESHNKALSK